MPDRTIIFSTNGRHGVRGQITQINPAEFQALQDDDDDLTYVFDMSAYLEGATISSVTRTPWGVSVTNASNTTTRLTQRLRGFGYVDYKLTLSSGDTEEFRVHISRRAPTALSSQAQAAIEVPVATTSALDPTTSDDSTRNFVPGNLWINTATLNEFTCISNAVGAARWRHHPRTLAASNIAVTAPADTAVNTLLSYTLLANAMGVDGEIEVQGFFTVTNNANAKTPRVHFGASNIAGTALANNLSSNDRWVIRNRTTSSQIGRPAAAGSGGYGPTTATLATLSVDTTQDVTILITGQKATGSDTMTLEGYSIRLTRPDIGPT